jgi:hypothetical protein
MSDETLPEIEQSAPETAAPEAAPQSAPQASGGFDTPWSAFKQLPEYQGRDDLDIARDLYQSRQGFAEAQRQLAQYQSVIPYATEYLRNQKDYEAWRAAQAKAQEPKPEEKKRWWSPPQIDESFKSYIIRDPQTGKEVIDPNAPLHAREALRQYQDYTANFARKFVTDPETTLKPFIEDVAMQKAKELVEQHLTQYKTQNYVQDLESQNADWLYDQNGQISQEGQAIQAYINEAAQFGIQGADARWKYATGMLQRDLLNLRYQQMQAPNVAQGPAGAVAPQPAQPADPVAQANMQFLRERATRTPNRSAGTTEPRAPRQRMSFEERLRGQLVNDGVI